MRRTALAITVAAVLVIAGVPAGAEDSSDSQPERPDGRSNGSSLPVEGWEGGGVGAGAEERGGVKMPVSSPISAAPKGNGEMRRGGLKVKLSAAPPENIFTSVPSISARMLDLEVQL